MRVTAAAGRLTEQPLFRFLRFLCYINADIWNYQLIFVFLHQIYKVRDMSNENNMRPLPKMVQDFEELRKGGFVYVDKTDMVWHIANGDKFNFLGRPRRFGKSLLTSTLHYYFEGRKDLFQGLNIMGLEKEWTKRQVFHFDFSGCNTADELNNYIDFALIRYEEIYGRDGAAKEPKDRFLTLIQQACAKYDAPVAILVDEYDTPLQHTLFNPKEHESLRDIYRSFFPALKTGGKYIKCAFLTGVTRFTQLSIFSTLNNVSIIGSMPQYATVCGLTEKEIRTDFAPELEAMGKKNGWSTEQTIKQLEMMYDGYHFSYVLGDGVYNPYSVINALANGRISNYWASSGASSLLNDMLTHSDENGKNLDGRLMTQDTLETADVSLDNVTLFLYQSGYLTVKDYYDGVYRLGIPNTEVRMALYKIVLPNALRRQQEDVDSAIADIKWALNDGDVTQAMKSLQLLVAQTPYSRGKDAKAYEDRYRFIVKNTLFLCGCQVEEEKQMATGRIDLVAHYRNIIMVMELKLDSNQGMEGAKRQMTDRQYTSAYSAEKNAVYAIAIGFSTKDKGITQINVEKIENQYRGHKP
jgi:hypothetical protein